MYECCDSFLFVVQSNAKSAIKQKDLENIRLREELNSMAAKVQEKDGGITHWKIRHEDINRQIADLEERHALVLKGKTCYF